MLHKTVLTNQGGFSRLDDPMKQVPEAVIEMEFFLVCCNLGSNCDRSFILQRLSKNTALYLIIYGRGLRTQTNTKDKALLQVLE